MHFRASTIVSFCTTTIIADVTELTKAINALPSVGEVGVSWTGGVDRACISSGNNIQITFLQDFGNLPLIIPDGTNLAQTSGSDTPIITVQSAVIGDKENDICSNHGTCDEEKGICDHEMDMVMQERVVIVVILLARHPPVPENPPSVVAMVLVRALHRIDVSVKKVGAV